MARSTPIGQGPRKCPYVTSETDAKTTFSKQTAPGICASAAWTRRCERVQPAAPVSSVFFRGVQMAGVLVLLPHGAKSALNMHIMVGTTIVAGGAKL